MSWVTAIWSMTITVSLTLAGIHLLIWLAERSRWSSLAFSVAAVSVAGTSVAELLLMRAVTPHDVLISIQTGNASLSFMMAGLVVFLRCSLGFGNLWVGGAIVILRVVGLFLMFAVTGETLLPGIVTLPHIQFLGETVTVVTTELVNPWWHLNLLGSLLFLGFAIDASIRTWRSGTVRNRRRAITIGGSTVGFILIVTGVAAMINRGVIQSPYIISFPFIMIILIVSYELTRDVMRARILTNTLRKNEESLKLAAQSVGFGAYSHDFETKVTHFSKEFREIYGLAEGAELELDDDSVPEAMNPSDRSGFLEAARASQDPNGARVFSTEFRIRRTDGQERWVLAHGSTAFSDTAGIDKPLRMSGIIQDITARKLMVQEMRELRANLSHANRVSSLAQLSSSLAHEINQPLGAIFRNAEAAELILQHPEPDLDELKAIATDILNDDRRAVNVVRNMRSLLKERPIVLTPVALADLVNDTIFLIRGEAKTHGITVTNRIAADLPDVLGDKSHLQQILLNLLINAMDSLKASPEGGQIDVTAHLTSSGQVELSVSDNGPGISADTFAHLFEPFHSTKPDGLGMGLAISSTIAQAHGGRLWADTQTGAGATFRLTVQVSEWDNVRDE